MSNHIIEISRDLNFLERIRKYRPTTPEDVEDSYTYSVICLTPGGCGGWEECSEDHEVDGKDAGDGPYDCDEDDPWEGWDEFESHGVVHTWMCSNGWTVPFKGCIVSEYGIDAGLPEGIDTKRDSRWLIEDDWDWDICYVYLDREIKEGDEYYGVTNSLCEWV